MLPLHLSLNQSATLQDKREKVRLLVANYGRRQEGHTVSVDFLCVLPTTDDTLICVELYCWCTAILHVMQAWAKDMTWR